MLNVKDDKEDDDMSKQSASQSDMVDDTKAEPKVSFLSTKRDFEKELDEIKDVHLFELTGMKE